MRARRAWLAVDERGHIPCAIEGDRRRAVANAHGHVRVDVAGRDDETVHARAVVEAVGSPERGIHVTGGVSLRSPAYPLTVGLVTRQTHRGVDDAALAE